MMASGSRRAGNRCKGNPAGAPLPHRPRGFPKRQVVICGLFEGIAPPLYCRRGLSLMLYPMRRQRNAQQPYREAKPSFSAEKRKRHGTGLWFHAFPNEKDSGKKSIVSLYRPRWSGLFRLPVFFTHVIISQRIGLILKLGRDKRQKLIGFVEFFQHKISQGGVKV